ncbi:MAG: hypothetical protein GEU91_08190 [Rhizobiales bacterium]|nr:hypothetical protein [Hyphomicrobiales bacterium]
MTPQVTVLHLQSAHGIAALIAFAWAISENRAAVPWRRRLSPVMAGRAIVLYDREG